MISFISRINRNNFPVLLISSWKRHKYFPTPELALLFSLIHCWLRRSRWAISFPLSGCLASTVNLPVPQQNHYSFGEAKNHCHHGQTALPPSVHVVHRQSSSPYAWIMSSPWLTIFSVASCLFFFTSGLRNRVAPWYISARPCLCVYLSKPEDAGLSLQAQTWRLCRTALLPDSLSTVLYRGSQGHIFFLI